jgi:glutathione S-transferase
MEEPVSGAGGGERPVLYTCAQSRGLRVSWTAVELGIELEYRMLPFPPRALAREYLTINPLGTVPALVHDGHMLTESSAIAHYLATRWGPTPLAVAPDEADYGAFLDFLHHADATLTFPQTVYQRFVLMDQERGCQDAGEAYATWYAKRLVKAEHRLESREYLCADRFTVADIAIAYALYLSALNGLEHLVPQRLKQYRDQMTARAGFIAAVAAEDAAALACGASRGITGNG